MDIGYYTVEWIYFHHDSVVTQEKSSSLSNATGNAQQFFTGTPQEWREVAIKWLVNS